MEDHRVPQFSLSDWLIKSGLATPIKFILQVAIGSSIGYWLGDDTGATIGFTVSVLSFFIGLALQSFDKK
jgi:hypothetical protein